MKTTVKNNIARFLSKEATLLTGNTPFKKTLIVAAAGLFSFIVCFLAGYYIGEFIATH